MGFYPKWDAIVAMPIHRRMWVTPSRGSVSGQKPELRSRVWAYRAALCTITSAIPTFAITGVAFAKDRRQCTAAAPIGVRL